MSEEEKEVLAPGFGVRFIREKNERMRQLAAWLEGSEAWREDYRVQQLAQGLLSAYPNEPLSLICAQLWLEVQALRSTLETEIRQSGGKISIADAAAFTSLALKTKQKQSTKKRMAGGLDEIAKQRARIRAEIKRHAEELWANDTYKEYKVTEVAGLVRDAVERDYPGESPGLERIKALIRPVAPEYARVGGAPKGPRKRSKP